MDDSEGNRTLTQSLIGGRDNTTSSAISIGNSSVTTVPSKCSCSRIRNMPTLFFIVTPMIIFTVVLFISTALMPNNTNAQEKPLQESMVIYLAENMMPYDAPNSVTLGLSTKSNNRQVKVDGLSDGIVNQTVYYSLQARSLFPWTDDIPEDVYMEYVVPFGIVNEPRVDYRSLFFDTLRDSLKHYERSEGNSTKSTQDQIKDVVKLINTHLWSLMGRDSKPIVFKASQTPRIIDPLSVVAYGHASCTGLSIFLVSALRTIGIPARMAGTSAWNGDQNKGDHSWVEVYVVSNEGGDGQWMFLEPTPGIAEGKEGTANADNLDRDPCQRWFCKADRFNGSTKTFATRYDRQATMHFPMAWAEGDTGVRGEDRTSWYTATCGKCM